VGDAGLAEFPAEKDDLPFYLAGEVEQADILIVDLFPGSVNLRNSIFDPLDSLFALRFPPRHVNHIEKRAPIQKHAVGNFLELGVDFFDELLTVNRLLEKRLEDGEQCFGFSESESAGHGSMFILSDSVDGRLSFVLAGPALIQELKD
jgi:hypothetical protein